MYYFNKVRYIPLTVVTIKGRFREGFTAEMVCKINPETREERERERERERENRFQAAWTEDGNEWLP